MKGVFRPTSLSSTGSPVYDMGDEIERLFVLDYSPMHRRVPEAQLIKYSAEKQVRQLQLINPRTQGIEVDKMTVVVSIDGACRDNGKPMARASWGVFFGPGSRFNSSSRLSPSCPQTSSRAEIEALSQAIDSIRDISRGNMTCRKSGSAPTRSISPRPCPCGWVNGSRTTGCGRMANRWLTLTNSGRSMRLWRR
ncbi:hypothetical protein N8I77_003694 [Diaporthe amygdali]|uniref:RNase H type-1 domain-containing protein n=1 Tax=Phomopsis amygdali TaxID=1214568 RepID=A0AAD9SII1_PHOAM|nr:hypothetical protein N8I77_003694 [Diaporthe amygdali]